MFNKDIKNVALDELLKFEKKVALPFKTAYNYLSPDRLSYQEFYRAAKEDITSAILATAAYFEENTNVKFGSSKASSVFYQYLDSYIDREFYSHADARSISKFAENIVTDIEGVLSRLSSTKIAIDRVYDNDKKFSLYMPISSSQIGGLAISCFFNNSKLAKSLRLKNVDELDYLATATPPRKKFVVYGVTGPHFGYGSEDGSTVIANKRLDSKKSRFRPLLSSLSKSMSYVSEAIGTIIGGFAAIGALEEVGLLPLANEAWFGGPNINYNLFYLFLSMLNSSTQFGGVNMTGAELFLLPILGVGLFSSRHLYKEKQSYLKNIVNYDKSMESYWENFQRQRKIPSQRTT